jgi:hypothetical protein
VIAGLTLIVALLAAMPVAAREAAPSAGRAPAACPVCTTMRPLCRHLASCDDAYFHLRQCGHRGLDADRDGIPCERELCGARREPARGLPSCPIS